MKHLRREARSVVLAIALAAGCTHAAERPAPPSPAAAIGAEVVHVAPPTGDRGADRASVLAALAQVQQGGTVQFAPGMYMTGGEIIRLRVPDVTLLGHPEGTVLRGCDPAGRGLERDSNLPGQCNLLELAGARQTVRNLTFEHALWALHVGCCWDGFPYMEPGEGGHLIEGNTFRSNGNAVRVHGAWAEPSIIRDNRFRNNWHSVAIYGNTVHLLDNHISALEPEEVPGFEFPWDAVGIGPSMPIKGRAEGTPGSCANNVVARNRIEGNADGIVIDTGRPGDSCRNNVVRDNTIMVSRVRAPARLVEEWGLREPTFIGTPIALLNYAEAFRHAGFTWAGGEWSRPVGSEGNDTAEESFLEGNVIEGNQIIGAEGLGMEILYASGNRIANNTFTTISHRNPFPGNFFGPRPEMGVPLEWEGANGSGIWVSPGSNGNEIVGNEFEEIAGAAVFIEGDHNRVETRDSKDVVRDLGIDNQMSGLGVASGEAAVAGSAEQAFAANERFVSMLNDESAGLAAAFFAPDARLVLTGGTVLKGRDAISRDFLRPNVARLRGLRITSSTTVVDEDVVRVDALYRARLAPAADSVEGRLATTWQRQPDDGWLIVESVFELPDVPENGPIRSGFFQSAGARLHYLDFGGDGLPVLFLPIRDRTAYTYVDFAERFTDGYRVLALTHRGTGQSEGELDDVFGVATIGPDAVALMDALGIERAVVFPGWNDIASYLAEQHPDRLAGLIYSGAPQPDPRRLWDADPTGVLAMAPRLFFVDDGLDPDEMFRRLRRSWYAPRFLEHDAAIDVPALFMVGQTGSSGVEDRWRNDLQIARWVAANPTVGDSLTRTFYTRLLADDSLQAQVRAVYRDLVAPAHRAAEQRFRVAFGEQLREVRLGVPNVSGYAYRDEPDLIYPHIRRFLDEIRGREAGATGGGHVVTPNGEQEAYTAPADVR